MKTFGGYSEDAEFFKMPHEEFAKWCGGMLAVALFEGRFHVVLIDVISYSHARGMKFEAEKRKRK